MKPFDQEQRERWQADRTRIKARKTKSRPVPMKEILDQLQSPEQLRTWLHTKQPQDVVGEAQTPDETVLANFLWETLGVYVLAFGRELWSQEEMVNELPAWCGEFAKVEEEHSGARHAVNGTWTAAEALAMLTEAERRTQSG